ncbi:MAG: VCBS repeat-containing protein [Pseudomonadota bacterium]
MWGRGVFAACAIAGLTALSPAVPFASYADGPGIVEAQYADPLNTYPHRIMGDIREKDSLIVFDDGVGDYLTLSLSVAYPGHVFEDIRPTLGDVDGDGRNDVVVVETSLTQGASIAVYSVRHGAVVKIAQTPFVGQKNRWYAPVGIGDFNGDGHPDVAFVDRPHLAQVLRIYSLIDGVFLEIATAAGLTNHTIGDDIIWSMVRRCQGRDEIVLKNTATHTYYTVWAQGGSDQIFGKDTGVPATYDWAALYKAAECL